MYVACGVASFISPSLRRVVSARRGAILAAALLCLASPRLSRACAAAPAAVVSPPVLFSAPFPLSAVRPSAGSRMSAQQARNTQYLLTLDSSRLACLYTSAANLTGTFECVSAP